MKTLRKIDIESMERELSVLDIFSLINTRGGFTQNNWECMFNCMEYIGNQIGFTKTDQDYYQYFEQYWGYDPSQPNSKGNAGPTLGQALEVFNTCFGTYQTVTILPEAFDNRQIMALKTSTPDKYHAVIPTGYDESGITYWDPTYQKSGSTSPGDVIGIVSLPDTATSGSVTPDYSGSGWLSGVYDDFSGYKDDLSGYYNSFPDDSFA